MKARNSFISYRTVDIN